MFSFVKNRRSGKYDVIGPASLMGYGAKVTVTKRSGEKKDVVIGPCGKPFTARFGPLKGKQAIIGAVQSRNPYAGHGGPYCYSQCPVHNIFCSPEEGPCHDCL